MPSIKKPKYVDDTIVEEEDNRTLEDLVKEVSLQEFLDCKKTREILQDEAYWKFEKNKVKNSKKYMKIIIIFLVIKLYLKRIGIMKWEM